MRKVALTLALVILVGCSAPGRQEVAPRITVESEGPASVVAPTEAEQFQELGAKVESVEGDVKMVRMGISELQKGLEEYRIGTQAREARIERASMGLLFVGVLLIAAAAPSFFSVGLTSIVLIVALAAIVASQFLPMIVGLFAFT